MVAVKRRICLHVYDESFHQSKLDCGNLDNIIFGANDDNNDEKGEIMMKASQVLKSMQDEDVVTVKGQEGEYVIVDVNDLLNLATLVKLTSDDQILMVSAKYENIEG